MAKPTSSTSSSAPQNPDGPRAHRDVFIARQPIVDRTKRVMGYELLFRATDAADAFSGSKEQASARVISEVLGSFGLDVMTHGRLAFINITRKVLLDGLAALMPPKGVVVELLEEIEADAEVVAACRRMKQDGYTLALDDFVPTPVNRELIPFADFIKADLAVIPDLSAWMRDVAAARGGSMPALVAERVETPADFQRAAEIGFTHFQGFFLGKPATQRTRRIPDAQLGYLRLLQALRDPELTLLQIENLIKPDAALCFRVLRTVNSAGFGLRAEVGSIRDALVLLGRDPVKRWVSLWAMVSLTDGSNSELLLTAIIRARMCEILWPHAGESGQSGEGFLLGMCSLLDAIFDAPMDGIVAQLPIDETLRAALLGDDNPARRMLDAVVAYEHGDWQHWQPLAEHSGLTPKMFAEASADAMKWAHEASTHGALAASA